MQLTDNDIIIYCATLILQATLQPVMSNSTDSPNIREWTLPVVNSHVTGGDRRDVINEAPDIEGS